VKRIAIEEHFTTDTYLEFLKTHGAPAHGTPGSAPGARSVSAEGRIASLARMSKIIGLSKERLGEMDSAGIDMQVLSLTLPGPEIFSPAEGTEISIKMNDEIFSLMNGHPGRFASFAAIAPQDPSGSARELERAVTKLGFKGAVVNSNIQGEYMDLEKYWPIFEKAQSLNVPIYIHPKEPSMIKAYEAYPALTRAMWGFAADAGLHAMRLICGGVFDQYPRLKIILGHLGESLPFWLWRLDKQWRHEKMMPGAKQINKEPSQYIKENFFITTSGMFWPLALEFVLKAVGPDRVMFAVDYPYESSQVAVEVIDSLAIAQVDKEKIYHLNSEKVLRL
jgi:5-carboxyvanillate decarboxylase